MKSITLSLLASIALVANSLWAAPGSHCIEGPPSCPQMQRCVPTDCSPERDAACFDRVVNEFFVHRASVSGENCIGSDVQLASLGANKPPPREDMSAAQRLEFAQKLPSLGWGYGTRSYKDKAVVIVHGSYGVPGFMDDFVDRYTAAGYNVVNCRLSGHGQRDEDLKQATLEDWQTDVRFCYDIARRLASKVELLGHSVGASLVAELAIEEAQAQPADNPVSHMHLLDPPIRFRGGARWLALRPGTSIMCKPVESGKLELMSDMGIKTQSDEKRMKRYSKYVPDTCTRDVVPPYNKQQYLRPLCEVRKLMLNHAIRDARVEIPTSIFVSGDKTFAGVFAIPSDKWLKSHLGPDVQVHRLDDSVHALMTIDACNSSFDKMWSAMMQASAQAEPLGSPAGSSLSFVETNM